MQDCATCPYNLRNPGFNDCAHCPNDIDPNPPYDYSEAVGSEAE